MRLLWRLERNVNAPPFLFRKCKRSKKFKIFTEADVTRDNFPQQLATQQYFRERLAPFETAVFVDVNPKMLIYVYGRISTP